MKSQKSLTGPLRSFLHGRKNGRCSLRSADSCPRRPREAAVRDVVHWVHYRHHVSSSMQSNFRPSGGGILLIYTVDQVSTGSDLVLQPVRNLRLAGLFVLPELPLRSPTAQGHRAFSGSLRASMIFRPAQVALLWVLDTLCTIFVAHSLYTYFVRRPEFRSCEEALIDAHAGSQFWFKSYR